jgi:hypothetical protein
MVDGVRYPQPSRDCVREACALKKILLVSGGRASVFYSDIANIVVRYLHPRVLECHLLLHMWPEFTISKFCIPSHMNELAFSLLFDYERQVCHNERAECYSKHGFVMLCRDQYENSVVDKHVARDRAEKQRECKKRGLPYEEAEKEVKRPKTFLFTPETFCLDTYLKDFPY